MLRYFAVVVLASFATQALAARLAVRASGVTQAAREGILAKHNEFRAAVSPGAKNMMKMHWNDNLASVAETWAEGCPNGHDGNAERTKLANIGISVGQNMAWRNADWDAAITMWHNEKDNFVLGTGSSPSGSVTGHYVQMVIEESNVIGCAFNPNCVYDTSEPYSGPTYVCNYGYQTMYNNDPALSDTATPYAESATPCVDCSGHCDSVSNKLCDCGAKVCKNSGVLNLGTCTCDCETGFTGLECENGCANVLTWCGQVDTTWCSYSNVNAGCREMCSTCYNNP